MFTDKRLTQAYKNAKVLHFDKKSKYIFFSDIHRGDDSVSDEFARNQNLFLHALDYYYNKGYTYVEVGDGDELWEYPKFRYIRIAHSDVFKNLKKYHQDKRLIILYGNHNIYLRHKFYCKNYFHFYDEYKQEVVDLLKGLSPKEALVLKHKKSGQEILVVHGHQGDFINDQLWIVSNLLLRFFWKYMHVVGFHNPSSPARNLYKRHKIEKNYNKWIKRHEKMLICGHTHRPKFPKPGELPYFNSGCCINTRGITGVEISDDNILLVDWRIRADKNGSLLIERNIIRGPEPISKYHQKNFSYRNHKYVRGRVPEDNC